MGTIYIHISQLGPIWAPLGLPMWVSTGKAHMGLNTGPSWVPHGPRLGCPDGTQLDAHDIPIWVPGGQPRWVPVWCPLGAHVGPTWEGWLGDEIERERREREERERGEREERERERQRGVREN